jgi:GMP synthase (glutamine-hydrolysing)
VDGVVLLGGPMSATANDPAWLCDERAWLQAAIGRGQPLFGICLGAQLLATCLGADVGRRSAEAGWIDVELLGDEETLRALSWHDEAFDLPDGAVRVARSRACPEQGFRVGERLVALQFHPEWTPEIVLAMHARFGDDMPAAVRAPGDFDRMHRFLEEALDRWALAAR